MTGGLADRLLGTYVGLTAALGLAGRLVVASRRRRGKEDPIRWTERLGVPGVRPPEGTGRPVWVHAASVGETVAVLPLVARIAATGAPVVFTTVTTTSAAVAAARLPPGAVHQFVPLDLAPCVDRFLDAWRPRLALFVESEIWPVAIARLAARDVPLVVANARMSDRSFRGWSRTGGLARALFSRIALCLAQSAADADRFRALGAPRVVDVGNIKYDAPVPEADFAAAAALATAIAGRPVLLAASTHAGEEAVVLEAFARLLPTLPRLLLVIAPRHPERGPEVAAEATARGFTVARRAAGALPDAETAVYVADTVGELGTFYRRATAAFVGGSLVPVGGHNPIEPARLGVPVIAGPDTASFREPYAALAAAGALVTVDGAEALAAAAHRLIACEAVRDAQVAAAGAVVARYAGALERTFALVEPMLVGGGPTSEPARAEARR